MTYNATGSPRIHPNWAAPDSLLLPSSSCSRLSIKKWAIGLHDKILIERSGAYLPLLRYYDIINREIIHCHLNQVKGAVVELEITHANGNRGNGLRVRGSSVLQFVGYDLKVYSLGDQGARSTLMAPPPKAKLAISVWTGELDGSRRLRRMWRRGRRGYWSCIPTASPVNRWIDESEYSSGREDELAKGKPEDAFQGMQRKDQRGVGEGVGPDVSDLEEQ
ncbi:hypothetical protein J010_04617 [Cryptococcus neoformans]|nr:hypothetical protein C355_04815 [Cryptococcus neoformans var. grubii Th84]OXH06200.1 hypothetical protein J010_04617 [Cryptococcus neoformans var. grubii]OXH27949.1 hypothetical protein J009_04638 [Cryptococcus neoformans var. grubii]OXH47530.1 hypothetical protein J004_04690 [Cryptococcus neoformans var. grubii]OXH48381.1 hypothetical protein J003_04590 [Cryptococcus neoformans var. grubii]